MRQPHLACRQGCRATAGRAARRERRVPGVARAPEHLVKGGAAGPELRRVRLGDDNPALLLNALDKGMGGRWDMIAEDRRAISGAYSSNIGQVFDRDRQTGEP